MAHDSYCSIYLPDLFCLCFLSPCPDNHNIRKVLNIYPCVNCQDLALTLRASHLSEREVNLSCTWELPGIEKDVGGWEKKVRGHLGKTGFEI